MASTSRSLVSPDIAAAKLGVPAAWLKREAAAGRVPSIRAGRRLLLSIDAVSAELTKRASKGGSGDAGR